MFVHTSTLYGNVIIVMDQAVFWLYLAVFAAVFAVGVPWLANLRQPTPSRALWALVTANPSRRNRRRH